jgi:CubicO group peptidase (beta-lactamase class C family)
VSYASSRFGLATCGLLLICGSALANGNGGLAARIEHVERGIPPVKLADNNPPVQVDLTRLMHLFKVPGLSIAVIDDFKIAWAKGYGVKEVGSSNRVTIHTLFQAGSVSKPVAAVGALRLVEQGKLALDQNVNASLKSWQVPDNEFTAQQKVTLRRLLSHSAGLTVHGFPGYAVDAPRPTTVQILNGDPPTNTAPVRVVSVPGTAFAYSGGGFVLTQLLITDVTGQSFAQYMREAVLDRVGMADSSYEQPISKSRAAQAASGTHPNGEPVVGHWHVYPEMAAAGLWTTASDLATFAIEVALSKQGKANHVLSAATTREMLTPQIEHRGLGFVVGNYGKPEEFDHYGDDEGFQAMLIMFADSGKGVAIMANSENGIEVGQYLVQSVAKEYGWYSTPKP